MIRGEQVLCDMANCGQPAVEVMIIGSRSWDCCAEHLRGAIDALAASPAADRLLDRLLGGE